MKLLKSLTAINNFKLLQAAEVYSQVFKVFGCGSKGPRFKSHMLLHWYIVFFNPPPLGRSAIGWKGHAGGKWNTLPKHFYWSSMTYITLSRKLMWPDWIAVPAKRAVKKTPSTWQQGMISHLNKMAVTKSRLQLQQWICLPGTSLKLFISTLRYRWIYLVRLFVSMLSTG